MKMLSFQRFFCLFCLFTLWSCALGQVLQAKKIIEQDENDIKVRIGYRASGGTTIPKVDIVDKLPTFVDLVSGELSATVSNVRIQN